MAGEGKWKGVAGDESSTSAAVASAAPPKQKPALQVIVLVSRLLFPLVFFGSFGCTSVYHTYSQLCVTSPRMFTPHFLLHSRISSHFTARFRSRGVLAPVHQKLCLSPAAPSQSPITFQRFSRSRPKTTFGLRHPLPYHVCCDFDFHAFSPWHRPNCSMDNPLSKLQWELTCSRCSFARLQQSAQHPSKPTTAKSVAPTPSTCSLRYTVSTPLPPMPCYWPNWPRSDREIDRSAGCQRSDLWATQNAWTPGPGVRFVVDLQWHFSQKIIHFFL